MSMLNLNTAGVIRPAWNISWDHTTSLYEPEWGRENVAPALIFLHNLYSGVDYCGESSCEVRVQY